MCVLGVCVCVCLCVLPTPPIYPRPAPSPSTDHLYTLIVGLFPDPTPPFVAARVILITETVTGAVEPLRAASVGGARTVHRPGAHYRQWPPAQGHTREGGLRQATMKKCCEGD